MNAEAANGPHWFERLQLSFIQNIFHLMMSKSNESGAADYVKTRPSFFFSFYCTPLYDGAHQARNKNCFMAIYL